ncbi:MAG: helicase-related protein [bacterium]|nr:helicase-related protein [bacterium]
MEKFVIPDIIDNTNYKLSDCLIQLINENSSVYIATGYLNLEGLKLIKEKLKICKEVKILIGKPLASENFLPVSFIEQTLKEEIEAKLDEKETINFINELISILKKDNFEIRIYKDGFYHGKFYIIDGGIPSIGSVAIVGSANLTYAGLTSNKEFNSVIKQESAVKAHKDKFLEIFNSNTEDYKATLISLLSNYINQFSPYDVFIKILYSYFEDKLSEIPPNEIPSPIILADFQKDGYIPALRALEKYKGVILADSVGLGKTYLALRLLDDFAYRLRQKTVIICPAQIKDTIWEPKLKKFGIKADIITQEKISRESDLKEFADYEVVVIDESHNFRNANTNRWKNLFQCLLNSNKKIILITATPVNNSVFDLYNQLRFITKDDDEFFKSAGINSLWGYFLRAHTDKETLYDLLEEISIRRSRPFIKKYYPNAIIDGKPIKFPQRKLTTIKYKLTSIYSDIYKECLNTIESLTLASYNIDIYRKDIFSKKILRFDEIKEYLINEKKWSQDEIKRYLMNLGRNEAVIGILRILLLKRLESSIEAFKLSIQNLLNFQKKFLELLDKNKILDRESYRKFILSQQSDEIKEEYIQNLETIDPSVYAIDEIKLRTKEDIGLLENIYNKLMNVEEKKDTKLQQLVKTLENQKGHKIVIFGYFKDTMRYIYNYLKNDDTLKILGIPENKISIVDSEVNPKERQDRITRFSPISNEQADIKNTDKEIQILISTDVLSEGQNLQDADTIINYDLPWNPVKIIQRIGRLDRIGSPYDVINVYNFFPEDELETLIKLLQRLYEKIEAIHRSVGLDESILGETPNPKDFGYIKDIFEEKQKVLDELEELSELAIGEFLKDEVLKYLQTYGIQKIKKIPNGIGSTIKRDGKKGVFVAFKNGDRHYWCFYDILENKIIENRLECIKIIKCNKEELPATPSPDIDTYAIIRKIKNHIISRLLTSKVKPPKIKNPQNLIVNFLQSLNDVKEDLIQYYSTPLPEIYLTELRKRWRLLKDVDKETILKNLEEFKKEYPIIQNQVQTQDEEEKEVELKLIAYMNVG